MYLLKKVIYLHVCMHMLHTKIFLIPLIIIDKSKLGPHQSVVREDKAASLSEDKSSVAENTSGKLTLIFVTNFTENATLWKNINHLFFTRLHCITSRRTTFSSNSSNEVQLSISGQSFTFACFFG